jgi:hypothetical protein
MHTQDPYFWRGGAIATVVFMCAVLAALTIDTLKQITPAARGFRRTRWSTAPSPTNMTGVIDWVKATIADPAFDYGAVLAIFATVPIRVPVGMHRALRALMNNLVRTHSRRCRSLPESEAMLRYYQIFVRREVAWVIVRWKEVKEKKNPVFHHR